MYEPSTAEIILTNIIGNTLLRPYNKAFIESLGLKPGERVLDFCCGSGMISREIASRLDKGNLVCADVSKRWLDNASKKVKPYGVRLEYLKDLGARDLSAEKFDKAVIHFTLHYFAPVDRPAALRFVRANMKPGGAVVIREPVSEKHGFLLHDAINLLERLDLREYEYSRKRSRLFGEFLDIRIRV